MATPPYRADHVGSLLRPDSVKAARKAHFEDKTMSAEELTAVEDAAILDMIKLQEDAGIQSITDGEMRRQFWHFDFMGELTGFNNVEANEGLDFVGTKTAAVLPTVVGKVDFPDDHPHLQHFKYLAANTNATPKISIPGPSCCHFRVDPKDMTPPEYQDVEVYTADLAATYKKAVNTFYDAGCRYLQMDDIFFAYLCDPKHRGLMEARGEDPDWLINRYAWMMREAIKDRPDDLVIGMHMCRGNFMSTYAAEGAYDDAAEAIFSTGVDIFFMEYDTERAGGLEPLRLLPKGKQRIMAGFITTKTGELESIDDLRRKYDEATQYVDIDQLGIAPQCGFSSTEEGNKITEDDQKRKLELVVKTAEAIWGAVDA